MVTATSTSRFLEIEERSAALLDELTVLRAETAGYGEAHQSLGAVSAQLEGFASQLQETLIGLRTLTQDARKAGLPQVLDAQKSLEDRLTRGLSDSQRAATDAVSAAQAMLSREINEVGQSHTSATQQLATDVQGVKRVVVSALADSLAEVLAALESEVAKLADAQTVASERLSTDVRESQRTVLDMVNAVAGTQVAIQHDIAAVTDAQTVTSERLSAAVHESQRVLLDTVTSARASTSGDIAVVGSEVRAVHTNLVGRLADAATQIKAIQDEARGIRQDAKQQDAQLLNAVNQMRRLMMFVGVGIGAALILLAIIAFTT